MAITSKRAAVVLLAMLLSAGSTLMAAPVAASPGPNEVSERESIVIDSDSDFDAAHGVVSGTGTAADPYVITGWRVREIFIRDTSKHVLIEGNEIASRLTLNWNGPGITVVDNEVGDLRVNQNVKRTGAATGGLIAHNNFGIVGQLRHFDGIFEHNVVRPRASIFDAVWGSSEAVQFDGFHGSRFRNNTLYGYLDVKLHGHHHGSGFAAPSHYHGTHHSQAHQHDHGDMDHTKRFHEVWVTGNTIYSPGPYALRYTDSNHRGDDRRAASEQNPELEKPHVHHTRIHLNNNRLIGSGLLVDIFNADDQNHIETEPGLMEIRNNRITLKRAEGDALETRPGIQVRRAKDLQLMIDRNVVMGEPADSDMLDSSPWTKDAGIWLNDIDLGHIEISNNQVSDLAYGVRAARFTDSVHWWVTALRTSGVGQDVYYDDTVANPPHDGP